MTDVVWKEPPERPGARVRKFQHEADQMRLHPGDAVLMKSYPHEQGPAARSFGNAIKIGKYPALRPAGAFDYTTATEPDDNGNPVVNVYAWYVGGDDDSR
jgi:hypothetical protein